MPQVWHLSLQEAKAALDAVGILYRICRAQNQMIPEGHLFSVAPVPGTIMRSGMEAVLNVSHGPPVVGDRGVDGPSSPAPGATMGTSGAPT
jgi:beta-lactam-binding protein with PASTA domain